jgi:hypothetical protein
LSDLHAVFNPHPVALYDEAITHPFFERGFDLGPDRSLVISALARVEKV